MSPDLRASTLIRRIDVLTDQLENEQDRLNAAIAEGLWFDVGSLAGTIQQMANEISSSWHHLQTTRMLVEIADKIPAVAEGLWFDVGS